MRLIMLFLTEVQKAGAHGLRAVICRGILNGAARPSVEVFNGLGFALNPSRPHQLQ